MFRMGYIKDRHDPRDKIYSMSRRASGALPPAFNLRNEQPPVYDQTTLGSCVGNGVANSIQFCLKLQGVILTPSRLQIYFDARELEGSINEDAGCMIRDAIKCVVKKGVCDEALWPYDVTRYAIRPPAEIYERALYNQVIQYKRVPVSLIMIKSSIVEGFPVVFGATLFKGAMSSRVMKTGKRQMPSFFERIQGSIGGHCESIVGYDDQTGRFDIKGSWGTGVGEQGYFSYPYEYMSYMSDMWQISLVEKNGEYNQ